MSDPERAQRAADPADRRARDAAVISRWTIGLVLAIVAVLVYSVTSLTVDVGAIRNDLAEMRTILNTLAGAGTGVGPWTARPRRPRSSTWRR